MKVITASAKSNHRNTARITRPVGMADGDGTKKAAGSIRTGEDCLSEVPLLLFYLAD